MFNKIICVFLLCITLATSVFAQAPRKRDEQIRKLKIEFVTQQMSLTQQQTQKFHADLYNAGQPGFPISFYYHGRRRTPADRSIAGHLL